MTFQLQLSRLRELLREKVKQGLATERGMAKMAGISQPHLHNVLKGIRVLPPELADRLMLVAGITGQDLGTFLGQVEDLAVSIRAPSSTETVDRRSCYLAMDPLMEPLFQTGDLVFFDQSETARREILTTSIYLVVIHGHTRARYLRQLENRLYLASPGSLNQPFKWDLIFCTEASLPDVVKGRILWVCRQLEPSEGLPVQTNLFPSNYLDLES